MGMHTLEQWAQHAAQNMMQAEAVHLRALNQCQESRKTHAGIAHLNRDMYDTLLKTISVKVKSSYRLIEKLQKRAESLEGTVKQTEGTLAMLEKGLATKDAPLQLCIWRLQQRERRPLREQVRDPVELALEEEKGILVDVQRRFGEAIKRTKAAIVQLNDAKAEIRHDIDQKLQALSVDEVCLRSTERSMHAMEQRASAVNAPRKRAQSAGISRGSTKADVAESNKNEVSRHHEAERVNRATIAREEMAKKLREDATRLIKRCEDVVLGAGERSMQRMKERVQTNQQMRRRLEQELRETEVRMDQTKGMMSETKHQIKALLEPMDLTAVCASWRKQRATREGINDPVSSALTEHRQQMLNAQQEMINHRQNEKSIMKDLSERRSRLKEDIRDKTAALHIDLNCITHEAVRLNGQTFASLSKKQLTRAMKTDYNFNPGVVDCPHTAR